MFYCKMNHVLNVCCLLLLSSERERESHTRFTSFSLLFFTGREFCALSDATLTLRLIDEIISDQLHTLSTSPWTDVAAVSSIHHPYLQENDIWNPLPFPKRTSLPWPLNWLCPDFIMQPVTDMLFGLYVKRLMVCAPSSKTKRSDRIYSWSIRSDFHYL